MRTLTIECHEKPEVRADEYIWLDWNLDIGDRPAYHHYVLINVEDGFHKETKLEIRRNQRREKYGNKTKRLQKLMSS